jgi:death on curing protein
MEPTLQHLTFQDYCQAAAEALGADLPTVRVIADKPLAESALEAPFASFGGHERYVGLEIKVAVLLQRVASNHALPDGNKRTALLCAILFVNLNGYRWDPPAGDEEDGAETAEVVEAAASGAVPLAALAAWVGQRLGRVRPAWTGPTIFPAEFVGSLEYTDNAVQLGDIRISDVHGFNPAGVYVRRVSGKTGGLSVAEIIISVVGDGYAQEELDVENEEAARYPLGAKEYWRGRMVGKYRSGADGHLMTDAEFEADWADAED